jgi:hypothetical protein
MDIPWRPGRNYNSQPCTYPGIQTAIVVGAAMVKTIVSDCKEVRKIVIALVTLTQKQLMPDLDDWEDLILFPEFTQPDSF